MPLLLALLSIAASAAAQTAPRLEPLTSGTSVRLQAVSVASPRIVWASGVRGTYVRTEDGGTTWQVGVVPGADSLEFRDVHAWDAARAVLLAAGTGDRSRIYHTEDGGKTWDLVFQNRDPKAFYDCIDFRGEEGIAASDAVDGLFPLQRTTDGGRTWVSYTPPGLREIAGLEGEGGFAASGTCVVLRPDGSVMFGTAKGARVIQVGPGGSRAIATPIVRGDMAGIASIAFRTDQVGVAGGGDLSKPDTKTDNLAVTRDGGRTWTLGGRPTFPGAVYGLAYVSGRSGRLVAVGPKGSAWSPDDGLTWRALDQENYWSVGFGSDGTGWMVGPAGRITKITFE